MTIQEFIAKYSTNGASEMIRHAGQKAITTRVTVELASDLELMLTHESRELAKAQIRVRGKCCVSPAKCAGCCSSCEPGIPCTCVCQRADAQARHAPVSTHLTSPLA
jgi:hypothetical protein